MGNSVVSGAIFQDNDDIGNNVTSVQSRDSHRTEASTTSQRTRLETLESASEQTSSDVAALRSELSTFMNQIRTTFKQQPVVSAPTDEQATGLIWGHQGCDPVISLMTGSGTYMRKWKSTLNSTLTTHYLTIVQILLHTYIIHINCILHIHYIIIDIVVLHKHLCPNTDLLPFKKELVPMMKIPMKNRASRTGWNTIIRCNTNIVYFKCR